MLFKSGFIFSTLTAVSRVLGLARDILIAVLLGVSLGTDVFFVALSFSQMLRGLALEGPMLQTMVSVFSKHILKAGILRARAIASQLSGWTFIVASLLTVFFFVFPESLVAIIGSGFLFDPERSEIARNWLPLAFCYALPILLVGIMVALQNSTNHFASTAITPIIFNICMIIALLLGAEEFNAHASLPLVLLVIPLAGFVQYGFHLWRSASFGLYQRPSFVVGNRELRAILVLLAPALGTLLVTQANTLTNNIIGSFLPVGSLSWINYANRVAILPVGVIGIAIVTVFTPALAKAHMNKNENEFQSLLSMATRLLLMIGVPAAIGVCLLAEPIAFSLFQYGNLSADDAHRISWALMILALNIPASMLSSLFIAVFFVRQQPKTALRVAMYLLPISVIIKLFFVNIWDADIAYIGLALGVSVASWVNVGLLWFGLRKHAIHLSPSTSGYAGLARMLVALVMMTGALMLSSDVDWQNSLLLTRATHLFADCVGGVLIYFSVLWLLGERLPKALFQRT